MKKINFKNVISVIFDILGVIFWVLGLCATSDSDGMAFALVNLAFMVIGSHFIVASLKINPERAREFLRDAECEDEPCIIEEHNYSPDFEALYNKILLRQVDEIIESFEVAK